MKPVSQQHCNAKTQSLKPASQYHFSDQAQSLKPVSKLEARVSHAKLDTEFKARISIPPRRPNAKLKTASQTRSSTQSLKLAVQHPRGIQNTRLEARVLTTEKLYVSVITALITGSITAHVMRGVNPYHEEFLGDSFTPKKIL